MFLNLATREVIGSQTSMNSKQVGQYFPKIIMNQYFEQKKRQLNGIILLRQ